MLIPTHVFSDFLGEDTVLTIRALTDTSPFLPTGAAMDGITGRQIAVLGRQQACVHAAVLGPVTRGLFAEADLEFPSRVFSFRSLDELHRRLIDAVAAGRAIVMQFPPRDPPEAELAEFHHAIAHNPCPFHVPLSVLRRVNDKANLSDLVPVEAMPAREYVPLDRLDAYRPTRFPVVLKAATLLGNASGHDVRICRTAEEWRTAVALFRSESRFGHGAIVERYEPFERTWCVNFAILPDGRRWVPLGAAEQVIEDGRLHAGNIVGKGHEAPPGMEALTAAIAERSMAAGFRGIAGFDTGIAEDGRLVCFDMNLRVNGSAPLLLLHDAICARSGGAVSRFLQAPVTIDSDLVVGRLTHLLRDGRIVPLCYFDASLHPSRQASSVLAYVASGPTDDDVDAIANEVARAVTR